MCQITAGQNARKPANGHRTPEHALEKRIDRRFEPVEHLSGEALRRHVLLKAAGKAGQNFLFKEDACDVFRASAAKPTGIATTENGAYKRTLVIDLDILCRCLQVCTLFGDVQHRVWARPNARAFLDTIKPLFRVAVWSRTGAAWANAVLTELDPNEELVPRRPPSHSPHDPSDVAPTVLDDGASVYPADVIILAADRSTFGSMSINVIEVEPFTVACGPQDDGVLLQLAVVLIRHLARPQHLQLLPPLGLQTSGQLGGGCGSGNHPDMLGCGVQHSMPPVVDEIRRLGLHLRRYGAPAPAGSAYISGASSSLSSPQAHCQPISVLRTLCSMGVGDEAGQQEVEAQEMRGQSSHGRYEWPHLEFLDLGFDNDEGTMDGEGEEEVVIVPEAGPMLLSEPERRMGSSGGAAPNADEQQRAAEAEEDVPLAAGKGQDPAQERDGQKPLKLALTAESLEASRSSPAVCNTDTAADKPSGVSTSRSSSGIYAIRRQALTGEPPAGQTSPSDASASACNSACNSPSLATRDVAAVTDMVRAAAARGGDRPKGPGLRHLFRTFRRLTCMKPPSPVALTLFGGCSAAEPLVTTRATPTAAYQHAARGPSLAAFSLSGVPGALRRSFRRRPEAAPEAAEMPQGLEAEAVAPVLPPAGPATSSPARAGTPATAAGAPSSSASGTSNSDVPRPQAEPVVCVTAKAGDDVSGTSQPEMDTCNAAPASSATATVDADAAVVIIAASAAAPDVGPTRPLWAMAGSNGSKRARGASSSRIALMCQSFGLTASEPAAEAAATPSPDAGGADRDGGPTRRAVVRPARAATETCVSGPVLGHTAPSEGGMAVLLGDGFPRPAGLERSSISETCWPPSAGELQSEGVMQLVEAAGLGELPLRGR